MPTAPDTRVGARLSPRCAGRARRFKRRPLA